MSADTTAAVAIRASAWDDLSLRVLRWGQPARLATTALCLPGFVRTADDYARFAHRHAARRMVVSLDYVGRGHSAWARHTRRYTAQACLRDVTDVCAALHIHRALVVGTSFGGLLAMALGAARPTMLAGVVLNDIGPEIDAAGADGIRRFVSEPHVVGTLDDAAAFLRARLPQLSIKGEAEWSEMAALTFKQGPDGKWRPHWDPRLGQLLDGPRPDLWPLFGALSHIPLLLLHGARSEVLSEATVSRMRSARPDMTVATIPDSGHAPTLAEPASVAAVDAFIDRWG
jgi:pimeloyl-ACP methyl ester carboxylesterase